MTRPKHVVIACGPEEIPDLWQTLADGTPGAMKILRGNGYEHFEFSGKYTEVDGEPTPVYEWYYRTAIAE